MSILKLLRTALAVAALGFVAQPVFAHDATSAITLGNLQLTGAFSRATLPNAPVGAGFLTITNTGTEADRLIAASTEIAGMVQLHEMKMENDVMKMAEVAGGIEIPAGGSVTLAPGGLHIMFMQLKGALVEGTDLPVTLTFEKAGTIELNFHVGAAAADAPEHADAHQHMSMAPQSADDHEAIMGLLKGAFETKDSPLSVYPIVIAGDYAIAGWAQAGNGGRALLKKTEHGWAVHLCSGDGLKDAANLVKIGVPDADAATLAAELATAEASVDPALLALFSKFDGTMMVDASLITPSAM
jgi:periplasmic copper chaperone A